MRMANGKSLHYDDKKDKDSLPNPFPYQTTEYLLANRFLRARSVELRECLYEKGVGELILMIGVDYFREM